MSIFSLQVANGDRYGDNSQEALFQLAELGWPFPDLHLQNRFPSLGRLSLAL
jgi:hypothetical protein